MSAPQNAEDWLLEAAKVDYWTAIEKNRPCVLYKPRLSIDGDQWCASYGDMPEGVHGFGASPELAMTAFDTEWAAKIKGGE